MRTFLLLGLLIATVVGAAGYSLASTEDSATARSIVHTQRTAAPSDIVAEADHARRDHLRDYVLGVMRTWPSAKIEMVPLEDVAASIASAVASDEPAWADDTTGARSAILLAALAYFEGARFAKYVDDGTCNELGFVEHNPLAHYGTCDHRLAHSLWQIHEIQLAAPREDATATALLDRDFAAHIALRLARQSLAGTATLRNYTGEWSGPCPKADERLRFADKAWREHPYAPPME